MGYTILITGASGYLGSVLCVDLSRDHEVIGLYRRTPSEQLRKDAPSVRWEKGDVADAVCMDCIFRRSKERGRPIDYVIHFAAYTGFGKHWEDEYSDTNVIGTRNIIAAAKEAGAKRILFAGSIAALEPRPWGENLTEQSPAWGEVAYPKSKALGERLLFESSDDVPVVILRLGGVFTDWCELPPLFSVMKMWSLPLFGRMIPGRGLSGFPYIHRREVVRMVRKIVEKDEKLKRFDTLFASFSGCTRQKELFPIIRRACGKGFSEEPIFTPLFFAKWALHGKYLFNTLVRRKTYERAWMLDYVDKPLVVDTTYTCKTLDWEPDPEMHILKQLPILMQKFNAQRRKWLARNINRNDQKYEYDPD